MKKTTVYLIMIITFLVASCSSIPEIQVSGDLKQSQKTSVNKSNYLTINTPYTLNSLLLPVLQMSNFMISMDYFDQFLDYNDYIFPDYLFTVLAMETDSYKPGEGTLLVGDSGSGLPVFNFEKAFLSKTDDSNSWWRFHMQSNGIDLSLEVLVNSFGIPAKIRFENADSGQKFEIVPDIAVDFERAITEIPPEQLSASVADKIDRSIEDGFSMIFINPVIIGEELINTPAGEFMSILVKDFQSESTVTSYWLSPDVPGGIIRISVTDSTGGESHITELLEISNYTESYFSGESIIPYSSYGGYDQEENSLEPGYSEGTTNSPILIYPDEIYYGSVGDEGTSYYKFSNNKRADLFIQVEGLEGYAELLYFGNDSEFLDWSTGSEGASLNVEDYMLDAGEIVYFSITDIIDEYSIGEYYNIQVIQESILDPIGIMMKGDIYNNAIELLSNQVYNLSVSSDGLDYYKTIVKKGSSLEITVLNEPEYGSLIWFDIQNGSYSGMYSDWSSGYKTITIKGLESGTECYYYFSSDSEMFDPLQKLKLEISEQ